MSVGTRRWLVPAVAAAAVLAVVGIVWAAQGPDGSGVDDDFAGSTPPSSGGTSVPGSSGSGAPGDSGQDEPRGDLTPVPEPDTPGRGEVRVDSYYRYDATHLALNYTTGVPECYGKVGEPVVEESARAVTVTLPKIPPKRTRDVVCIDIALMKHVDIILASPLGDREVRDGSRGGATVEPGAIPGDEDQAQ